MFITVKAAECHPDTCLDVFTTDHGCNINPVGGTTRWRIDCDDCFTCVRVMDTKEECLEEAKKHVLDPVGHMRSLGLAS